MQPNFALADLECDVGMIGTVSRRVVIDPTVLVTVISAIIVSSLMHQQL
jgi:hypothetical protein